MKMDRLNNTDPCTNCEHMRVEHAWEEHGDDGIDTFCYQDRCGCKSFVEAGEPVVAPGHDQFGTERGFLAFCRCKMCERETVEPDMDLLVAIKDHYDACLNIGVHPEWTIGGA